jgi:hypothetical protein
MKQVILLVLFSFFNILDASWYTNTVICNIERNIDFQSKKTSASNEVEKKDKLIFLMNTLAKDFPFEDLKKFEEFKNTLNVVFSCLSCNERKIYLSHIIARRIFAHNSVAKDQLDELLKCLVSNSKIEQADITEIITEEKNRINEEFEAVLKKSK